MRTYYAQMNTGRSAAAACSGWLRAAMAFVAAIFAGIVAAVSVVFFAEAALAVRLCFGLILLVIGFCSVILSAPAKAPMR